MTDRSDIHYVIKLFLECNIWGKGTEIRSFPKTIKISQIFIMGRFLLYGCEMCM